MELLSGMVPTPEELRLGQKAYDQVRYYEKHTVRSVRQAPWIMAFCVAMMIVLFRIEGPHGRHHDVVPFLVPALPILVMAYFWQCRAVKNSYSDRVLILKLLREKYGESLPWVVEEENLARARELDSAIAAEHQTSRA